MLKVGRPCQSYSPEQATPLEKGNLVGDYELQDQATALSTWRRDRVAAAPWPYTKLNRLNLRASLHRLTEPAKLPSIS